MVRRNDHLLLDDMKLWMSQAVLEMSDLPTIRAKSLSNLLRWRTKGTWGQVYDQWWQIMTRASDKEIIEIMVGAGDESNRLRQSIPYTGLMDEETRQRILSRYYEAKQLNDSLE